MVDTLKIRLVQSTQWVGDIRRNVEAMREARSRASDCDLVLYPEMQLIGYPPEDLVLKPALIERAARAMQELASETADGGPAMLVGSVFLDDGLLYNGVALLCDGKVAAVSYKHELPNYGTFDERRHFAAGPLPEPVEFKGVKLGLPICEDIWHPKVCAHLKARGAEILLSPNGSPYEIEKDTLRLENVCVRRAEETGLPLAYVNRVGGQDELVFDGASFVVNGDGALALQMRDWSEEEVTTIWRRGQGGWACEEGERHELADHPEDAWCAMMIATRDYIERNNMPGVIIGLSGGIDSAVVAALAVDALGPERVWCVMLPSRYTADLSLTLAEECADALGVRHSVIPIQPAVDGFDEMLSSDFADTEVDLTEENIQSRIRGVTLMALSNKFGQMVLTTGNKSEMSVGYATIYGDMAGGYNPLKDAYKTTVFRAAAWRNTTVPRLAKGPPGEVIPQGIINRPPSAELRHDQKDEDSLPPYDVLDAILLGLVEHEQGVDKLVAQGFDRETVIHVENLLHRAEYKRRQSAPGVKLGTKNFGRDRRYPITHGFRTGR
ncbi:NAD+ synthase [Blastomonas marina]|uniref:Glutamine-dependent NAD(+) synthetase n=1 Tax=Blastomonas marina TaxID=1867408 RepID=A0ABQ1F356_9SPHN|nr:NAD+ synthase [Blastomonas marina]GFZ97537.1 NAD+ synthase [Blastomonas marina]